MTQPPTEWQGDRIYKFMSNYGLLDPMLLDNSEEPNNLKCAGCGLLFNEIEDKEDYDSIDNTGMCNFCDKNRYSNF